MKADYINTAVIVPVYNSSVYLEELVSRISKFFSIHNIYIINDGSTDNSGKICLDLKVNVINFLHNSGKGAALNAGFIQARKDGFAFAFSIDSDLQHNPEFIPEFIEQQNRTNADLIIGVRDFNLRKMPVTRILSNCLTTMIVSFFIGKKIQDSQSGYRLYNLLKFEDVVFHTKRYQFETEILFKIAKCKGIFDFVKIETIYNGQKSHISHLRDIFNFIKIVNYEIFNKK